MDPTRTPSAEQEPVISAKEIELAKVIILAAIDRGFNGAFLREIDKENNGKVSKDAISRGLNQLIKDGIVRQKEDSIEHEWEYLRRK